MILYLFSKNAWVGVKYYACLLLNLSVLVFPLMYVPSVPKKSVFFYVYS